MLNLFLKSIKYRWFEYLLAAIIVAMVVAVVTVQRSLSSNTEKQIHELAHDLGKNMLVVPKETDLANFYAFRFGKSGMPASYPEKIQESDSGKHISLIQSRLYGNIDIGDNPFIIVGERSVQRGVIRSPVPLGEVILGQSASNSLGVKEFDDLKIQGKISSLQLKVNKVADTPMDGLDTGIFTSLEVAQEILDRPEEITAMRLAGCWCRVDVPTLASDIENILPDTKALTVQGMIKAQKGTLAVVKKYSVITYVAAVLLIGGIVIILVSSQVRRQKREIGLFLAIGMSPWIITMVFVLKAGLLGVLGGLSGYMLGYPLTKKIAATLIGTSLPVPEASLIVILGFSVMVSVVSALVPAVRAARLDPTEVLREV